MDTGSMVMLGLGLSLVVSLGLISMYQNFKRSQREAVQEPSSNPKKKRKKVK